MIVESQKLDTFHRIVPIFIYLYLLIFFEFGNFFLIFSVFSYSFLKEVRLPSCQVFLKQYVSMVLPVVF